MSLEAWVKLNAAPDIGPRRFHRLLRAYGSPEAALAAPARAWSQVVERLSPERCAESQSQARAFDAARELERCAKAGVRMASFRDPDYPAALLSTYDPPPLLYWRGEIVPEDRRAVALVGTRQPTEYGARQAALLAEGLAARGVTVVSGLARGIDTCSHLATLEAGGRTLAVLGTGLGMVYPEENTPLARRIAQGGGAVLSQYHLDAQPERFRFPLRNATISGLSLGVVVVEGEEDSGSLITADHALEQGREVFAIPGPLDSPMSAGPLKLIQQGGAKLVRTVDDILVELASPRPAMQALPDGASAEAGVQAAMPRTDLKGDEAVLHALLQEQGRSGFEALAARSRLAAGPLAATLTLLELKGAVRQLPGKQFEAL
jgi:DNA processing protein